MSQQNPTPVVNRRILAKTLAVLAAAASGLACSNRPETRPITYEKVRAADDRASAAPARVTNVAEVAQRPAAPTATLATSLRPGEYPLNPHFMAYLPTTWDGRPGRFLVDTGSTLTVVNRRIASTLTPAAVPHRSIGTAGAEVVDVPLYNPPHRRVGPFDLDRYGPVAGFDFTGMSRTGPGEMLGVVGSGVLADATLRLDFDRSCFAFLPPTVTACPDLGFSVPLAFEPRLRLPRVRMTVDGRPVDLFVDTGDDSDGSLAADVFDDERLMRVLPGHKHFTAAGPGKDPVPVREIDSISFDGGHPYHHILFGRGGPISRIGMRFLARNDAVTISPASGALFVRQRP